MEKQDEFHGNSGDSYDFGARLYDARLGRWLACDPLEKKYPSSSSFTFVLNTPIQAFDPDGEKVTFANDRTEKLWNRLYKASSGEQRVKLDILINSDVVYNINVSKKIHGGATRYNFKANTVEISIEDVEGNEGTTFAILGDETTHALQFEKGELGFVLIGDERGTAGYDLKDEADSKEGSMQAIDAINKEEGTSYQYPGMVKRMKEALDNNSEGKSKADIINKFFRTDKTGQDYLKYDIEPGGDDYNKGLPGNQLEGESVDKLLKDKKINNYAYRKDNKTIKGK